MCFLICIIMLLVVFNELFVVVLIFINIIFWFLLGIKLVLVVFIKKVNSIIEVVRSVYIIYLCLIKNNIFFLYCLIIVLKVVLNVLWKCVVKLFFFVLFLLIYGFKNKVYSVGFKVSVLMVEIFMVIVIVKLN